MTRSSGLGAFGAAPGPIDWRSGSASWPLVNTNFEICRIEGLPVKKIQRTEQSPSSSIKARTSRLVPE